MSKSTKGGDDLYGADPVPPEPLPPLPEGTDQVQPLEGETKTGEKPTQQHSKAELLAMVDNVEHVTGSTVELAQIIRELLNALPDAPPV